MTKNVRMKWVNFMKLSEKLIILRENNHYTQTDIAKYLGVGQTTYSRYETLKTYPDIFIIKKLAKLYQISIDELLKEVDDENINITLTKKEIETLQTINKKINEGMQINNLTISNSNGDIIIGSNIKNKK